MHPCHARPSLPVVPDINPTPPNLLTSGLHDTAAVCWCGWLGQVPQPWLSCSHWLGHLPRLTSPVALLLYKFYLNHALLSRATAAAGHCKGSLFPKKFKRHYVCCKSCFQNVTDHKTCRRRFLKF